MPPLPALLTAFLASLFVGVLLVLTRHLHGHLTLDGDVGVQKLHRRPTPRIGGLAMFIGAIIGGLLLEGEARSLWALVCLAALPGFIAGLAEDLTKRVGVKERLFATICSGLIFCLITGYSLGPVDIPGIDQILALWLPSVLITAFAIGGIANAVNIIDGVNGLASGTVIIILSGFAILAWNVQDMALFGICLVLIGGILGFFVMNFPLGLLFFGDAGAYTAGFMLAVVAVMLPLRNPELSPLLSLLALAYPVIETMVSIHRRMVRQGSHPGQPDRLHLHSLVYRDLARRLSQMIRAPQMRNPMTAVVVWFLPLLSSCLMVLFGHSTLAIWLCILLLTLIYLAFYRKVAMLGSFIHQIKMSLRLATPPEKSPAPSPVDPS